MNDSRTPFFVMPLTVLQSIQSIPAVLQWTKLLNLGFKENLARFYQESVQDKIEAG